MAWDTKSTHSLEAWAEYQRKQVDALAVIVIRKDDSVLAADELLDVIDVHDWLWDKRMPGLLESLRRSRDEKREAALKREAKARAKAV